MKYFYFLTSFIALTLAFLCDHLDSNKDKEQEKTEESVPGKSHAEKVVPGGISEVIFKEIVAPEDEKNESSFSGFMFEMSVDLTDEEALSTFEKTLKKEGYSIEDVGVLVEALEDIRCYIEASEIY